MKIAAIRKAFDDWFFAQSMKSFARRQARISKQEAEWTKRFVGDRMKEFVPLVVADPSLAPHDGHLSAFQQQVQQVEVVAQQVNDSVNDSGDCCGKCASQKISH